MNAEDVKEQIKKLGKKGMTPSEIGEVMCKVGDADQGTNIVLLYLFQASSSVTRMVWPRCVS